MSKPDQTNYLPLKMVLHASFFIVGIITVLLGQLLPILAKNLTLNDEQAGFFFTAQSGGSIIGTVSTAFLIKRLGFVKTPGIGFLLFVTGLSGLNFGGLQESWASVFIYGIGVGLAIPSTLMLTAALNPQKTTSALNLMSFVYGLGAIVSQPFVSLFGSASFTRPVLILVVVSVVFTGLYFFVFIDSFIRRESRTADSSPKIRIWSNPKAWLIMAFGFFDVGIEMGVAGWLTSYTFRSDLPSIISWLSATPIFFAFFVAGRGLAAILARFFSNNQIIWASLLITLSGTILLCFSSGWVTIFISAAVLGLGLAAVFPTNMARFTETFGPSANEKTVPLFVMGSLGTITITWLIGYVSTAFDGLRAGLSVLLAAAVVLLVLQSFFQTQKAAAEGVVAEIS